MREHGKTKGRGWSKADDRLGTTAWYADLPYLTSFNALAQATGKGHQSGNKEMSLFLRQECPKRRSGAGPDEYSTSIVATNKPKGVKVEQNKGMEKGGRTSCLSWPKNVLQGRKKERMMRWQEASSFVFGAIFFVVGCESASAQG